MAIFKPHTVGRNVSEMNFRREKSSYQQATDLDLLLIRDLCVRVCTCGQRWKRRRCLFVCSFVRFVLTSYILHGKFYRQ